MDESLYHTVRNSSPCLFAYRYVLWQDINLYFVYLMQVVPSRIIPWKYAPNSCQCWSCGGTSGVCYHWFCDICYTRRQMLLLSIVSICSIWSWQLSTIGRCEYEKTCALLIQLFDQSAQDYQKTIPSSPEMAIQEGKFLLSSMLWPFFVCRWPDLSFRNILAWNCFSKI